MKIECFGSMRNDAEMKLVKNVPVTFDSERVYRLLGWKGVNVSSRLEKQIERCVREARRVIDPKVLYTTQKISHSVNGVLELAGDVTLKSAKLAKTLGGCSRATVFLATLGKGIDALINRAIKEKKLSDAYIYDAIGSAVVEGIVDEFQRSVDAAALEEGKKTTLRFSPGYCDWKIRDQEKLFGLLDGKLIGVELNESCLMEPRKSVSGVFGIGESRDIDKDDKNPCRACGKRNCIARRA